MDVIFSFEISVDFQRTTQSYVRDNITVNSDRCENLKYIINMYLYRPFYCVRRIALPHVNVRRKNVYKGKASYPVGTGVSFTRMNRPGLEANRSSPPSVDVKNVGDMSPLYHMYTWQGI
jgi:hypothetical protein